MVRATSYTRRSNSPTPSRSSASADRSAGSPRNSAAMPSIARSTAGGGGASTASGKQRPMRSRVLAADASGSCTPTTPRSPQAMPQAPIAVSNKAKPRAVMAPSLAPRRPNAPEDRRTGAALALADFQVVVFGRLLGFVWFWRADLRHLAGILSNVATPAPA